MIDIALAAASIAVLCGLLYVYGTNVRTLRAPLSFGLIVFAGLFLAGNLAAMYFYISLNDSGFKESVAMPMLALNVVELVGFSTLFYVSWR